MPFNLIISYFAYDWTFGVGADPATATGANPGSVSYSIPGEKIITLTEFGKQHETLHIFLLKLGETGANFITENNSSEEERDLVQNYLTNEKVRQKRGIKETIQEIIELSYN